MDPRTNRLCLLSAMLAFVSLFGASQRLNAADEAFVGRLAIAIDDDVAKRLNLSDDVKKKLVEIIDRREQQAIGLASQLRDLPPMERDKRLAPFVAESEKAGLELLTPEQRTLLGQLRVAKHGLATLAEEDVSGQLKLSDEQKQKVLDVMDQRAKDLAKVGERERSQVKLTYERKLNELLSREQVAAWEKLAGFSTAEAVAQAAPATSTPAATVPANPTAPTGTPAPSTPSTATTKQPAEMPAFPPENVKLKFNFRYAPYKDVLEWFADQAGLSLQAEGTIPGTFNYRDNMSYTPAQAIDILNRALLIKGYSLVRHGRMLTVINFEEKVPDILLEFTPPERLEERGEFELTRCMFQLNKMKPEDAEAEAMKLKGPLGSVVTFTASRQLMVTETGGKLRELRKIIQRIEDPMVAKDQKVVEIVLKSITPEEFMVTVRDLFGLQPNQNFNNEIRFSIHPTSSRILVTGNKESVEKAQEIVTLLERDQEASSGTRTPAEQPQLETYFVRAADPAMTLKVLQTLLAGLPDVRLDMDTTSGKLIAFARPNEHKTILATIKMLEGQTTQFETISLRRIDPATAISAINKFFGLDGKTKADAPIIDGDASAMKLFVRGTETQISQIKSLLENLEGGTTSGSRGKLRMIPLSGAAADAILQQAQTLWTGENRIRMITPAGDGSATTIKQRATVPPTKRGEARPGFPGGEPDGAANESEPNARGERPGPPPRPSVPQRDPPTTKRLTSNIQFVSFDGAEGDVADEPATPANAASEPVQSENKSAENKSAEQAPQQPTAEKAPASSVGNDGPKRSDIKISVTPQGILISSDDEEALDRFEELLRSLAGPLAGGNYRDFTIFYLRYARAEVAQILIQDIMGGSSSSGSSGGSGIGGMASNLFGGGLLGGLMGGMMGGGGGSDDLRPTTVEATGTVRIVADPRLNALFVYANATDIGTIGELLKVIDREGSITEIETDGAPRILPLKYIAASEAAEIVKQVFASRMSTAGQQRQQPQQPSPEEFIRALRGGGGGGQRQREQRGEPAKMTVGVDQRNNALIVTAPEPLFNDVKLLIEQIDQEGSEALQSTSVYTLKYANPSSVQKALASMLGSSVKTTTSTSSSTTTPGQTPGFGGFPGGGFGRGFGGPGGTTGVAPFGRGGGGFPGGGFPGGGGGFQGGGGNRGGGGGNRGTGGGGGGGNRGGTGGGGNRGSTGGRGR